MKVKMNELELYFKYLNLKNMGEKKVTKKGREMGVPGWLSQ